MENATASPRRRWWQRRAEERALTRETAAPIMLPSTAAGTAVSPRSAMAVADAYACIRALSDAAASLPLHVYRRTSSGRERVEGGTAELLRNPAPAVTQAAFIAQLVAHLNLYGEAFIAKYRGDGRAIEQLGLLSPDRVHVEVRGGLPLYTISTEAGHRQTVTAADVIHIKGLSLDGLRGLSPVRQAREAIGSAATLAEHGARFFRNGARPSGVLRVAAGPASEEVVENLREGWEARHGGAENAGRVAVLTGEASFEPISMPLADAQFLEQRQHSTAEIARIFRVPPWVIGAATNDSLTYSTVAEQSRHFVTYALRPWLTFIEQAIGGDADLFPSGSRTYPAFELDALLAADPKTRSEVYTAALDPDTGWMTRAEVRAREDLPAEQEMAHA